MKTLRDMCLWLVAAGMMVSCLSNSNTETTLYNDAAITSFSLGTLNRTVTTTDTTYTTTVTGSSYKFTIEQVATWDETIGRSVRHIYNTDSLPTGTDAAHVLCTVAAKNSGVIIVKDAASDTLRYYSSTDSLDFTTPRSFYVYSTDGENSQEYLVKVNVHQEEGDVFSWQLMASDWTPATATTPTLPADIRQLLGGSTTEQYALSTDNLLKVSTDGGLTWATDQLDDSATLLPTDDVALVSYPMTLSAETDYVLLAGRRAVTAQDGTTTWLSSVWRKIVDYGNSTLASRWAYMEPTGDNPWTLPALEALQLVKYDDGVLALGKPYTQLYQSRDNGITWKQNAIYRLPADFDATATAVTMTVDGDDFLWLYCEGTGQVWRGRLNRLGWEQ